ncbi:uncharacterized protein LOC129749674 [Uranotaenia lowii]|uniref:uncharacterized protein LOC129749674 n=1 Tax=Uranotaenia lowii TaxID=190385 RepID=UPI00247A27C0|nr:uncharacterized protein LOC129749674 [Uranotaenia lowii]
MLKGFAKFNGYTVAVACINYTLTIIIDGNVQGGIVKSITWLDKFVNTKKEIDTVPYTGLFVASVLLFMGIFLECKVLMLPFPGAYGWLWYVFTDGTFMFSSLWLLLFTAYAGVSFIMLMMIDCLPCCPSRWTKKKELKKLKEGQLPQHTHQVDSGSGRGRCWQFWCCLPRCFGQKQQLVKDTQSHCSCDTLNIRMAGPTDRHYHRVVFL